MTTHLIFLNICPHPPLTKYRQTFLNKFQLLRNLRPSPNLSHDGIYPLHLTLHLNPPSPSHLSRLLTPKNSRHNTYLHHHPTIRRKSPSSPHYEQITRPIAIRSPPLNDNLSQSFRNPLNHHRRANCLTSPDFCGGFCEVEEGEVEKI